MKGLRFTSHLRLFFLIAVVIPCVVLTVIAIRSINREKAYIEKRFQETLTAEIFYTVSLLNQELDKVREELNSTSPSSTSTDPKRSLSEWKTLSQLVNVPFLLSPDYEILWPRLSLTARRRGSSGSSCKIPTGPTSGVPRGLRVRYAPTWRAPCPRTPSSAARCRRGARLRWIRTLRISARWSAPLSRAGLGSTIPR